MEYKIVFTDIDGTLLNYDRELSPTTIKTIKTLKDKLPFVLISARMPAAMRHLQKDLDIEKQPIICYNGGLVLIDGKAVTSTEIPLNVLESLLDFNREQNCHLSLYHKDEWFVPENDQWTAREENNTQVNAQLKSNREVLDTWKKEDKGAHKIMAMGDEAHIDAIKYFLDKHFGEQLHLYRSKPTYLEISNKKISKLTAIKYLLDNHFNLKTEETIAFGDNYNDVEMIKGVGLGVAVGNAREEVLEVANIITNSGKEDGVAQSLKELFKIE